MIRQLHYCQIHTGNIITEAIKEGAIFYERFVAACFLASAGCVREERYRANVPITIVHNVLRIVKVLTLCNEK